MDDAFHKNILALSEQDKILLKKISNLENILKIMENNIGTLNGRLDTLQNALQKQIAGGYGRGSTVGN